MIGRNYLSYDGTQIPTPIDGLDIEVTNIENVNQSESGTDLVSVVRLQKKTFNFSLQLTKFWLTKIKALALATSSTQTFDGENITGRLRITKIQLVKDSEKVEETNGLYIVECQFMEI